MGWEGCELGMCTRHGVQGQGMWAEAAAIPLTHPRAVCAREPSLTLQSLYTGVYKNGGPTNVDKGPTKAGGLASHLDR